MKNEIKKPKWPFIVAKNTMDEMQAKAPKLSINIAFPLSFKDLFGKEQRKTIVPS